MTNDLKTLREDKKKELIKMKLRELIENSDGVKRPLNELFDVKCKKCGSNNITIDTDETSQDHGNGCGTCGYGGGYEYKYWLGLKCLNCGNAKVIFKSGGSY